jgi:hypothetical protein
MQVKVNAVNAIVSALDHLATLHRLLRPVLSCVAEYVRECVKHKGYNQYPAWCAAMHSVLGAGAASRLLEGL